MLLIELLEGVVGIGAYMSNFLPILFIHIYYCGVRCLKKYTDASLPLS
tara:strand:+ start:530 stop:673 length:144 start_codon:yes stop_codon:yes gene_type:complete